MTVETRIKDKGGGLKFTSGAAKIYFPGQAVYPADMYNQGEATLLL